VVEKRGSVEGAAPPKPTSDETLDRWRRLPFRVWSHRNTAHVREVALSVRDALLDLGCECDFAAEPNPSAVNVLLGSNLLAATAKIPERTIVYNLEQLAADSPWLTPALLDLFQRLPLWDYSSSNLRFLAARKISHGLHVPIGAFPPWPPSISDAERTFDVAIIGAETKRRLDVARALSAAGLKVVYAVHTWGAERDDLISRSRISLNVHTCTAALLETTRLNLLLAHSAFIVSEEGRDLETRATYAGRVVFAPYEELVSTCVRYATDPDARNRVVQHGADRGDLRSIADLIRDALLRTPLNLRIPSNILDTGRAGAPKASPGAVAFLIAERRFRSALELLSEGQALEGDPRAERLFRGLIDHFIHEPRRRSALIVPEQGLSPSEIVSLSTHFSFPDEPSKNRPPLPQRFLSVVAAYFLDSDEIYEAAAIASALLAQERRAEHVELLGDCYARWRASSAAQRCYCIAFKTLGESGDGAERLLKKIQYLPRSPEDVDAHVPHLLDALPATPPTAQCIANILWRFERRFEATELLKNLAQSTFDDASFLAEAAEKLIHFGHRELGAAVAARATSLEPHHPTAAAALAVQDVLHGVSERIPLRPIGLQEALEFTARIGEALSAREVIVLRDPTAAGAFRLVAPRGHVAVSMSSALARPAWVGPATCFVPELPDSGNVHNDSAVGLVALAGARPVDPPQLRALDELSSGFHTTVVFDPRRRISHDGHHFRMAGDRELRASPYGFTGSLVVADPRLPTAKVQPANVLAIVASYNERDIIATCIEKLLDERVKVWVLDNWSDDGTWELLKEYQAAGRIVVERFPQAGPTGTYEWAAILSRKEEIASLFPGFWIIHHDADEIRRSPWRNVGLREAFGVVDAYGANCVSFTVLNFKPVDNGFQARLDAEKYFNFYAFAETQDYRNQTKAWKQPHGRVGLVGSAGHEVDLPNRVLFPYRFLLKHYPLRTDVQAARKIHRERIARFTPAERGLGWHTHYDGLLHEQSFVVSFRDHLRFDANFYDEHLAERLVGSRGAIWRD
jgi:hypothetical protein